MRSNETAARPSSESANLDVLRAVAVACVLCGHAAHTALRLDDDWVWRFAQMGVLIFFVHTSLVLMRSLARTDGRLRSLFAAFYIRRAFRIYPLAILCVLFAYAVSYSPSEHDGFSRHWTPPELLANLTLTQNLTLADNMWGGLWSLPLEVQMYAVLPILYVAFRRRSPRWLLVLWVAAIPLAVAQANLSARLSILGYLPCFLGGVIAWRLEKGIRPRLPAWAFPLALGCVSAAWLSTDRQHAMYHRWAFCLALGLALPHFADMRSMVVRPAKVIAKYSYGIYMSHMFALALAFEIIPEASMGTRWLIFASLAIALPVVAYHAVEEPMMRLGQRVAKAASKERRAHQVRSSHDTTYAPPLTPTAACPHSPAPRGAAART